ncbi:hypothetical protein JP0169_09640 [Helicobacter pylori]
MKFPKNSAKESKIPKLKISFSTPASLKLIALCMTFEKFKAILKESSLMYGGYYMPYYYMPYYYMPYGFMPYGSGLMPYGPYGYGAPGYFPYAFY